MRGHPAFAIVLLALLGSSPALFAQMDNLTNLSVEWMRMPARNAAVDSADSVVYNPAGLVRLEEGWHFALGNQSLFRKPEHRFLMPFSGEEKTYGQAGADPLLPNFYAAYRTGSWAVYGGAYISGGGAVADYPEGSVNTEMAGLMLLFMPLLDEFGMPTGLRIGDAYGVSGQFLKASSYYLTFTAGAAWKPVEAVSFSLGGRYIRAKNRLQAGLTLGDSPLQLPDLDLRVDSTDSAGGAGAVVGLHVQVSPRLWLASHFESAVKLDFETAVTRDDLGVAVDGAFNRRDLPAAFYGGLGWQMSRRILLLVDYNYWFQKRAAWGDAVVGGETVPWSELAGDCYAAGAALAYRLNDRWLISAGAVYTGFLFSDKQAYYARLGEFEAPKANNWNVGAGCAVELGGGLRLNLALGTTMWKEESVRLFAALPLLEYEVLLAPLVKIRNKAYSVSVGLNLDL